MFVEKMARHMDIFNTANADSQLLKLIKTDDIKVKIYPVMIDDAMKKIVH